MAEPSCAAQKRELAADILRNGGSLRIRVQGASMLPEIWPGDVLTVESTDAGALQLGEVILVCRSGDFVIHRLIAKSSGEVIKLTTRGDAMPQADPIAGQDQLLGRVTAVHRGHLAVPVQRNPSLLSRLSALLLRESDLLRNLALRRHAMQQSRVAHAPAHESGPALSGNFG
jgi:signal peptidase I